MACHLVIVAQSGSGKSTFLGRIVEELMLGSRARCLVIDPNADFWRIHQVEDDRLWTEARYDFERRRGKLPHEARREEFATRWANVQTRVYTARADLPAESSAARFDLW